jgi:oligosaccharide repeat unit polymerase
VYNILLFIYIIILTFPFWNGKKLPIFHPSKIVCIFYFLYTVPFLLVSINNKEEVIHEYVYAKYQTNLDELFLWYILFQSIGIMFLYLGIFTSLRVNKSKVLKKSFKIKYNFSFFKNTFFFFFSSGILLFFYLLSSLGGIEELLLNAYMQADFLSGSGHLVLILNSCLFISVISLNKALSFKKINLFLIIFIYIIYFLILSIFGGRSNFILLIMISFFSFTMFNVNVKFLTLKNILILFSLASYVIIMPLIRGDLLNSDYDYVELIKDNLYTLAKGNEYVSIQLSILGSFNFSNLWLGASYMDLLYSFIPSSIYLDKPPVAEGVYFFNNIIGNIHTPPYPARKMILVGWPPGTMGIMYSNFHIFGIAFGYYILGILYKYSYLKLLKSNYSIPIIYLYLYIIIKFELTNHYIFHLTTLIILLRLIVFFQRKFFSNKT